MSKSAIFRFEASPNIGVGHAMRCCVLADKLVEFGWSCMLVTSVQTLSMIPALQRFDNIAPDVWQVDPRECDLFVVDNYDLDVTYESKFRDVAQLILVIDDLANRKHNCDILLDQTLGRSVVDYINLVPENCLVLTGAEYTLIRKDISKQRLASLLRRKHAKDWQRALVSLGGADDGTFTIQALAKLKEVGFLGAIDITLGFAPNMQTVEEYTSTMPNVCLLHTGQNISELLTNADFAIGAAGSSCWERACLGLPQFLLKTAKNQELIFKNLGSDNFNEFYNDRNRSNNNAHLLAIQIDGLGVFRVINHVTAINDKQHRSVWHSKVTSADMDLVFSWVNNQDLWRHSFNREAPDYAKHKEWFTSKIADPYVMFEKIIVNGIPCGTVRLDYIEDGDHWRLSWYILPQYQGSGIGTIALRFAKNMALNKKIKAEVLHENIASKIVIERAGFKFIREDLGVFYYVY